MTKRVQLQVIVAIWLVLCGTKSHAEQLRPATQDAWDRYLIKAQVRMQARVHGNSSFLWVDEDPGRSLRVREGEVEVDPVINDGSLCVPHGLIHDWIGAVFIPNVSAESVTGIIRNYNLYKQFFAPLVVDSRTIERSDGDDRFSIRWVNKTLFVTSAVDAEFKIQTGRLDDHRLFNKSYATSLQEIKNYGKPDEHDLPPGQGNGYIWRLYSVTRVEERDGGVYLETEVLALTRDVPISIRFVIAPEIKVLSRNALLVSLRQSRAASLASTVTTLGAPSE